MNSHDRPASLNSGAFLTGLFLGVLAGALLAWFKAPQTGAAFRRQLTEQSETLRARVEASLPVDPVEASLVQGKEAARRRRQELGLAD
ncbi:MAG: YtxH domain-containing protein [Aggregatilineales bacterium]